MQKLLEETQVKRQSPIDRITIYLIRIEKEMIKKKIILLKMIKRQYQL